MIEIECPYCKGDIELDNDDSGLFRCPYCDHEFLWESESKIIDINTSEESPKSDYSHLVFPSILISILLVLLVIVVIIFAFIDSYSHAMSCGWQNTC